MIEVLNVVVLALLILCVVVQAIYVRRLTKELNACQERAAFYHDRCAKMARDADV